MKIAIISDIHAWHWMGRSEVAWNNLITEIEESIAEEKPDVVLDAGDYEETIVHKMIAQYVKPANIFTVEGNHDFYGKTWVDDPSFNRGAYYIGPDGLKIAACTMWTNFDSNPNYMIRSEQFLADKQCIKNFTAMKSYDKHLEHVDLLKRAKDLFGSLDIVLTHHTPSFKLVHPKYLNGSRPELSYGFSSHLDDLVSELAPKIWACGHTHDRFDLMIDNTRVVCNPCGYPGENPGPYKPVYVEI